MAPATRSATRRESRWADLPPELVEAILRLLPLDDYSPFGLACKPWWSAMRSLFKPPPLLILNPYGPHLDADPGFYSICGGGKHRDIPVLRLIPFNICHGIRRRKGRVKTIAEAKSTPPAASCGGSSKGWLLMVDVNDESCVHLLNPVSAEKVALPALPHHFTQLFYGDVLCSKPASDPDCIVAVIGSMMGVRGIEVNFTVLLTCRPKDDEWVEIPYEGVGNVVTCAFYEARLYVISLQGMFIYNFDPYPRNIPSFARKTMGLAVKSITLLAVMDGKLLCVSGGIIGPLRVYEFVNNCRWVKIQSLGEWVLLLNRFTSQAFLTKESPTLGFRANCIYRKSVNFIDVHSMEDDGFVTIPPTRPEGGSESIYPTLAEYQFQAYWFLAQSWFG